MKKLFLAVFLGFALLFQACLQDEASSDTTDHSDTSSHASAMDSHEEEEQEPTSDVDHIMDHAMDVMEKYEQDAMKEHTTPAAVPSTHSTSKPTAHMGVSNFSNTEEMVQLLSKSFASGNVMAMKAPEAKIVLMVTQQNCSACEATKPAFKALSDDASIGDLHFFTLDASGVNSMLKGYGVNPTQAPTFYMLEVKPSTPPMMVDMDMLGSPLVGAQDEASLKAWIQKSQS